MKNVPSSASEHNAINSTLQSLRASIASRVVHFGLGEEVSVEPKK